MVTRRLVLWFALLMGLAFAVSAVAPKPQSIVRHTQPVPGAPGSLATSPRSLVLTPGGRVIAQAGEPVTLTVPMRAAGLVEIDALGLQQYGDRRTPARMTFIAYPAGTYPIVLKDTDATLGTLVVQPASTLPEPPSGAPASGVRGVPAAA